MIYGACRILTSAAAFSCCLIACTGAAAQSEEPLKGMPGGYVSVRSISGRFLCYGEDRTAAYDFSRWMEDISIRTERLTGSRVEHMGSPVIHAFLRKGEPPGIVVSQNQDTLEKQSYDLKVVGYQPGLAEDVLEAVVGCLAGHIAGSLADGNREILPVPAWLVQGLAQNLYPHLKARNAEAVLSAWRNGALLPVSAITSQMQDSEDLKMARGMYVAWLLSCSFGQDIVQRILSRGTKESGADADWLTEVLRAEGVEDPDYEWDAWILKQKRIVYRPGVSSREDFSWLNNQLKFKLSDLGVKDADSQEKLLELTDLIALKREVGVGSFCTGLFNKLKLRAAGRGESFRQIIDAYCLYLEGIAEGKSDRKLRRYLLAAERMRAEFENNLQEEHPADAIKLIGEEGGVNEEDK